MEGAIGKLLELMERDILIKCVDGPYSSSSKLWYAIHYKTGFAQPEYDLEFTRRVIELVELIYLGVDSTKLNYVGVSGIELFEALDYFNMENHVINTVMTHWCINQELPVLAEAANSSYPALTSIVVGCIIPADAKPGKIRDFCALANQSVLLRVLDFLLK